VDYQQLIHLPTDPGRLQSWIERNATGGGPRFSDIFGFAESLLVGAPLPPTVGAAKYRVIARLPGMRLIGPTRDPLSRPGVAVGLFLQAQPGRIELIFNPTTGGLLASAESRWTRRRCTRRWVPLSTGARSIVKVSCTRTTKSQLAPMTSGNLRKSVR
jgi:hypothetical protein